MVLKAEKASHARGPQDFDFMLEGRGRFDGGQGVCPEEWAKAGKG